MTRKARVQWSAHFSLRYDHPRLLSSPTQDVYTHSTHQGHNFPVLSLSFSPDCKTLVSCSNKVLITDVPTGRLLAVLDTGSGSLIRAVRYSPDGSSLVTAADDCTICLWSVIFVMRLGVPEDQRTGKPSSYSPSAANCSYNPTQASTSAASPSPTNPQSKLAKSAAVSSTTLHQQQHERLQSSSAAALQQARKHMSTDLAKALMQCLVGHRKAVTALVFTPDGRTLISVALDRWACSSVLKRKEICATGEYKTEKMLEGIGVL